MKLSTLQAEAYPSYSNTSPSSSTLSHFLVQCPHPKKSSSTSAQLSPGATATSVHAPSASQTSSRSHCCPPGSSLHWSPLPVGFHPRASPNTCQYHHWPLYCLLHNLTVKFQSSSWTWQNEIHVPSSQKYFFHLASKAPLSDPQIHQRLLFLLAGALLLSWTCTQRGSRAGSRYPHLSSLTRWLPSLWKFYIPAWAPPLSLRCSTTYLTFSHGYPTDTWNLNLDSTSWQPLKTSSIFNPALQSSPKRKWQLRSPIAKTKSSGFPLPHTHPTCNPSSKPQWLTRTCHCPRLPLPLSWSTHTLSKILSATVFCLHASIFLPRLKLHTHKSSKKAKHCHNLVRPSSASHLRKSVMLATGDWVICDLHPSHPCFTAAMKAPAPSLLSGLYVKVHVPTSQFSQAWHVCFLALLTFLFTVHLLNYPLPHQNVSYMRAETGPVSQWIPI